MSERGCGKRQENGLYACVGFSAEGLPIEAFLVDPVIPWKGSQLRAPMLIEDAKGIFHFALGVGKQYYPFVPDFVEEARHMGVSKRIPLGFDVSKLTPDKSKMLLIHPRAIPKFAYHLSPRSSVVCPIEKIKAHQCIHDLWSLSALKSFDDKHITRVKTIIDAVEGIIKVTIQTPSSIYTVIEPEAPRIFIDEYSSGIILSFPTFHFEWVNREGKVPKDLRDRMEKAQFKLDVTPE